MTNKIKYLTKKNQVNHNAKKTLIRPAKQCTSMPSGITPLFSWSRTYSSWLFSAFIRNIPSACHAISVVLCTKYTGPVDSIFRNEKGQSASLSTKYSRLQLTICSFHGKMSLVHRAPVDLLGHTDVFALEGVLLAHCSLWGHMIIAWILWKLQKQWHYKWRS